MSREVIFRGFHPCDGPDIIVVDGEKVKGRWVYGYYAYIGPMGEEKHYIIPKYASSFYGEEVLPRTVGQYTGIDSLFVSSDAPSGSQRIFSGNVLCGIKEGEIGIVTYWELYGGYILVGKNGLPNEFTHKLIANAGNWGHLFNRGTIFDEESENE